MSEQLTVRQRHEFVTEINRIHEEISDSMLDTIHKAIRAGQLILLFKSYVPHGQWRGWVKENIDFSYRTVRRYAQIFIHKDQILKSGSKNVDQAERFLRLGKVKGPESVEADYSRIDRDLIAPIRVVRKRLKHVTYRGNSPETMEMIFEKLREEVESLLRELKDQ